MADFHSAGISINSLLRVNCMYQSVSNNNRAFKRLVAKDQSTIFSEFMSRPVSLPTDVRQLWKRGVREKILPNSIMTSSQSNVSQKCDDNVVIRLLRYDISEYDG